jgi:CBS domain-containing protein
VQSYQQVVVQDILDGVPVQSMMRADAPAVPPGSSIAELVYNHVMGTDERSFPVLEEGRLAGVVTLEDIRAVPRDEWERTTVREIMTPVAELVVVSPGEDAAEALNKMMQRDVRQLPVVQNGRLVGLLRRRDIMRWLQLQSDVV